MNANSQYDCECSKAELDLFTTPPLNTSMEKGAFVSYHPISSLTDSGPIEFNIPGSTEEYTDLGRTRLYVKVKIIKDNGAVLGDDEKVGPTNLFLHGLFSQVDLKLRDTLVTPSINTYPYKSYLETLLTYGRDAKKSQLTSELWCTDNGNMNEFDPYKDEIDNLGFKNRAAFTSKSHSLELMGRLHCDMFLQDRYLVNGVDMSLKLIRSPPAFHLMAEADGYKTVIEEATLFVRRVKLNPTIALEHSKMLDQGKMIKYPLRRSLVSTFTIPANSLSFNKENVVSGQLPRRVVIGFVKNAAFNGTVKQNPYNFEHFGLNYLTITNGSQVVPSQPLTPNFAKDEYLAAYMTLFEGTGLLHADRGHGIGRNQYSKGYALYVFDLTADMCEGAHIDPIKYGNLRMEVHFAQGLPASINAVVYAEYDNIVQVDRARNIITDFSSS